MKAETVTPAKPADPDALHKRMMQLLSGLWITQAIGSFARLGLADAMHDGASHAAAIATAARGLDPDRTHRLLRALATVGIVTEMPDRHFALTPLGRLLTSAAPQSMKTTAAVMTEYNADIWGELDGALQGALAFEAVKGQPLFSWLNDNPGEGARFQRMMVEVHGPETPAIVAGYDFRRFTHVVDVGGGHGALLSAVLAAHPGRRGTLFDLAPGIAAAKRGDGGPLPGVTFAEGDVFDTPVPVGGDLYMLRHLLHDYDDDDALRILQNVRRAMSADARLVVLEKAIPDRGTPGPGRWLDLHVMLLLGGRERTEAEYAALFTRAGLRLTQVIPTAHPAVEIIEAVAA